MAKRLTQAERVAKLEAELKAAKEKEAKKNNAAIDSLLERRAKLIDRIKVKEDKADELNAQIYELDTKVTAISEELSSLGYVEETARDDDQPGLPFDEEAQV